MTFENDNLMLLAKLFFKAKKEVGVIDGNQFVTNHQYAHEILMRIEASADTELVMLASDVRLKLNIPVPHYE